MHVEGALWKLVRASMTIVGLVPPVFENGELLIDGGYLNNMPVDVMRGLGVDTVRSLSVCRAAQQLPSSSAHHATLPVLSSQMIVNGRTVQNKCCWPLTLLACVQQQVTQLLLIVIVLG